MSYLAKGKDITQAEINVIQIIGALGTSLQVLRTNTAGTAVEWGTSGVGDMVLASAQTNSGIKTFLDTTMKLRNVANTFDGYFVNTNSADRIYTLQNRAGILADDTDLGLKANLASPTFTGTVTIPTPFTLGAVSVTPTGTELNYVDGVTSAIQTQLNTKMVNPMTTGGDVIYGGASGVETRLANGTVGQVLTSAGTTVAPTWETLAAGGDMVLASIQSVTGLKTFDTIKLAIKGSSTGSTAVASANASATSYTATLQAGTGTIAYQADVTYIGTTSVALNRGSAALVLTGITSIDGSSATCVGLAGSATILATTRAIYGNNFNGSAALTQIISSVYGGTGNGFTKFTGATTTERVYTLPDASSTLLYSGGALGTPSGGTLTNVSGLPLAGLVATTAGYIVVGAVTTGIPTYVAMSGDVTISNTGVTTVAAGTESAAGKLELATDAEMTTGTDTSRAITPANAKVELDKKLPKAGGTMTGKIVKAGTTEVAKAYTPATGAQTVAIDCAVNNIHQVTGHADGTGITFTVANATSSQPFIVSILQGATTVSTITAWFATVRWAGGSAPTLTATLSKRDTFGFIRTGADTYDGFVIGQNA